LQRDVSGLALALAAALALFCHGVFANPVPADEQSLLHGSDLYALHCADCHGWAPMERFGERFNDDGILDEFDFSDLVEQEYGSLEEEDNTVYIEDEDKWPEWAEFPDPGDRANDPDERRLIMEEMTRAIDDHYGTGEEEAVPEEAADVPEPGFTDPAAVTYIDDRKPGATDLLKPDQFLYGSGEYALFNSIADGDGVLMPGFRHQLDSEESIWDLVNFLRSLWAEEDRYAY